MSARLALNEIPYFQWKGKTFNQVVAFRQLNKNTNGSIANAMMPGPLKIYRKEIASVAPETCNRGRISVDDINNPGQNIVTESTADGIVGTLDFNWVNNTTEHPGTCRGLSDSQDPARSDSCMAVESNARARVRSAGMIKRKFDTNKNNDIYYTSSKQYLESRKRLFSQNQYNYIQYGNKGVLPGSPQAVDNIYSANGLNHCSSDGGNPSYVQIHYKPNNYQYAQQGAVSASSRILRLKYNTITTNGGQFATGVYGTATASALAYSSRDASYTIKNQVGYPNIMTPVIDRYSGQVKAVCDGRQLP